jgi:SPP1 family phage portal protein
MQDYLAKEITQWLDSPGRAEQIAAAKYLMGRHDILNRQRQVIGKGGTLETSRNLPNNRLVDNQYGKLVRQKVNYLMGNPFRFEGKEVKVLRTLHTFFNLRRRRVIRAVCEDSMNTGIGWVMPIVDAQGRFELKRIPPYEVLPFWADGGHSVLDCAVRVYEQECMDYTMHSSRTKKVEVYTPKSIERYTLDGGKLLHEGGGPWLTLNGKPWGWGKVPLIAFKAPCEQALLNRVKSLQDALNTLLSDFQNSLQEDARNTILVLKNYDGADLAEFRHNLAAYGAVRVKTIDGTQGGVETLRVHVDHQSYEALSAMLKRAIIDNGMGFDICDGALRGTPNRMTLLAMYADIELDSDSYECEWKAGFEELLGFIGAGLVLGGGDALPLDGAEVFFDRYTLEEIEGEGR